MYDDEITSGQANYENSAPATVAAEGAELERIAGKLAAYFQEWGVTAEEIPTGDQLDEWLFDSGERAYYATPALEARVIELLTAAEAGEGAL
jgi:hypothetical protein